MPPIQLVVFDMAGTTVKDQNEVQRCFFDAAASTGLNASPAQITAMMGWSKKKVFQTLWDAQIGQHDPSYAANVETSFAAFKQRLEDHYKTQAVEPTDGCLQTFEWLKSNGIYIALNTGFYREVTDIILARLGWNEGLNSDYVGSAQTIIQASVTPSEIFSNEGRPAPFMIQKAMYRLGVSDPKQVIAIGDTPSDVEAGKNAGCRLSLAVTNGSHTAEQFAEVSNDGLLSSLWDLKAVIVELQGGGR